MTGVTIKCTGQLTQLFAQVRTFNHRYVQCFLPPCTGGPACFYWLSKHRHRTRRGGKSKYGEKTKFETDDADPEACVRCAGKVRPIKIVEPQTKAVLF